jgi:hypothetical protein
VPQEKKAKMMSSSRKSCMPLESWPRTKGTPPPFTVAPTGFLSGMASSRLAVRTRERCRLR